LHWASQLRRILFLAVLFVFTLGLPAASDPFLLQVREKLNSIKPFRVSFINRVISGNSVDIEEKGVMTFRDSGAIKWEYLEPDHKVWILTGNSYEYYDHEDEQVTRGKLDKKTRLWIFQILYEKEPGDSVRTDRGRKEIRFINSAEGADFRIYLSDDLLPLKVVQKDPTGVDIVYLFSKYRSRVKLPEDEFKLKISGNVDIIELE